MLCGTCNRENDNDARFCEQCGASMGPSPAVRPERRRKAVLYGVIAIAVAGLAALGYYQFILPRGVAAVVNGEVIRLAEVDAVLAGSDGIPPAMMERARYRVLSDLIAERIAWQEARNAGFAAAPGEIEAAYGQFIAAAGSDRAAADEQMRQAYGSIDEFRRVLARRVAIRKFIAGRVAAGIADPAEAGARIEQWMREASSKASVRVALAGQMPGDQKPGCSCCNGKAGAGPAGGPADPKLRQAQQAALAYWRERSGAGDVEARAQDFGCHVQVDIIRNNRIAKSLRYQNGTISEL